MKKLFLIIIFLFLSFILTACKQNKIKVNLHYNDTLVTVEVNKNSIINFDNIDDNYLLIGWFNQDFTIDLTNQIINSDMDLYAKTIALGTEYKISYNLNGGLFNSSRPNKYYVGETTLLVSPSKQFYYEFIGWTLNGEFISEISNTMYGDITLDANWIDKATYYKINYELNGGTTNTQLINTLRQGDTIQLPDLIPANEKDYFLGWYLEETFNTKMKTIDQFTFTNSNEITLHAKFGKRDREHTLISFLGDSITTYYGFNPTGYEIYYPTSSDVDNVNKTWWMNLTKQLGYTLLKNNSYSGSCVGGTSDSAAKNLDRVKNLVTSDKVPDIVVVYMGTNDWAAGRSVKEFKQDYKQMLDYIYQVCGNDVMIFLCLMPTNSYSEGFQVIRENLNNVIIELANEYNLNLIDFRLAITKDNLEKSTFSGCHPSAYGMEQMANEAYKVISEVDKDNLSE